jgi:tetratricopeptide (TPR) repeat protein
MIRAAFALPSPDPDLLGHAGELVPEDAALGDVRLRLGGLAPLARAELYANAAVGASPPFARAMSIRAAEAYSEGGDHAHAAQILDPLTSDGQPDAIAGFIRARARREAGEVDAIADDLGQNVLAATDDVSRALGLERVAEHELRVRKDAQKAQAAYEEILSQYPNHVASNRAVERLAMERGDDETLARTEEALARIGAPSDAAARARLAVRIHRRKSVSPEETERVLRNTFDYGEVDLWLAREVDAIARRIGDDRLWMQAWAELSDLLDDSRERMAAELRLAEITARLRSPSAAQTRLSRAVNIDLKYPTTGEILGRLRRSAGDPVAAAEAFEDAARRSHSPERKAAQSTLAGTLYEGASDPERAAKAYFAAAKADPKHADVIFRLMRLLPVHRQHKALADLLTQRVAMGGDKGKMADVHRMLARVRLDMGDPEGAKKSLRTVTTLDATRVDAFEELARICVESKDSRGAAEAFQKIVITSRDGAVLRRAYVGLANIFESQRDIRRTKEVLRKIIEIFPDDSEAKQRLAMMEAR